MEELKRRAIRADYHPGDKLPSVRDLAVEMAVNPNTIARVYRELEREGFIETRRGQGSFVTDDVRVIERIRAELIKDAASRFTEELAGLGLNGDTAEAVMGEIRKKLDKG
jgi:GntR family transcriptional regulator